MWDVLDTLYGKAAERLGAALRDPLASEALVGVLETWEATDGTLAAARERHGIKHGGAVAVRLRETRAAVPNESANADLVARVVFDAIEIEGRFGIDEANELKRAARAYADAARRLRDALARAEDAAPKPKARQPDRGKAARQRLAADLCRALGGETDEAFWEVFAAVWRALDKDNADNPDPPNMQDIRAHLKKMRMKGNL
ncbi:hypothetical protein A3731_07280 [Roseovarius sp. HI0049]|nr:hypothetical protein A3731_07280 [Roseovarius sp. HI0049]